MEPRLNLLGNDIFRKLIKQMIALGKVTSASTVPAATLALVNIRASQLNGCSFCLDMHIKDALRAGETAVRLSLVAAWQEATVFTRPEKAALELTEQATRLADEGTVSDEAWASAAEHYDEDQLAALVAQIAIINLMNRLNTITRQPGGDYTPGLPGPFLQGAP